MGEKMRKVSNTVFWLGQSISLASIVHDLTLQELIREKVYRGELALGPVGGFVNENFVGDVGNAYAAILFPTVILEACVNLPIQRSDEVQQWIKDVSRFVTKVSPYILTALFLLIAHNVEVSTNILGAGTGDDLDYYGAVWGALTALPATVRFAYKVFPK